MNLRWIQFLKPETVSLSHMVATLRPSFRGGAGRAAVQTAAAQEPEATPSPQGYAAEMDNPLMARLVSTGLRSKKDVLFGNMEEIYHFHHRSGLFPVAWAPTAETRRPGLCFAGRRSLPPSRGR